MAKRSPAKGPERQTLDSRPRLVLTHGEKGGVGKTTVARLLADFLASRGAAFQAFDGEGKTGQFLRFYPSYTSPIDVADAGGVAPVLDLLMDGHGQRLALVDLGARSADEVNDWLYKGGALEEAASGNLGITVLYVIGGTVDSVGHLKNCFAALGSDIDYVLVKNLGVATKFQVYDGSNTRKELLAAGAREICLPALDAAVYQAVDRNSLAFSTFAEGQGTDAGFTERRYCRTWLRECFAALEEIEDRLS
jgi:hypothetical protein